MKTSLLSFLRCTMRPWRRVDPVVWFAMYPYAWFLVEYSYVARHYRAAAKHFSERLVMSLMVHEINPHD